MIIKNKTVLVTGAGSGIGEACAAAFACEGARVILTGKTQAHLEACRKKIIKKYPKARCMVSAFDVRDIAAVRKALETLPRPFRAVDVLINNAGLGLGKEKFYEGDPADWDVMIDTNIKGLLYISRFIAPEMVARGKGHIINISSIAGRRAYPGGNVYCATKAAVRMLSSAMRIDLIDTPVRVTDIAPGKVKTDFSRVRFKGDAQRAKKEYLGFHPLSSHDIAEIAVFVVSRPDHVVLDELLVTPREMISTAIFHKRR